MMSNEEYRFGSAAWSDEGELRRAGLLSARGLQIGYSANKSICLETDAPIITVAGAGSGKMRDLLALAVARNAGNRNFILDPRGEIAAVTMVNFVLNRSYLYCWNPTGMRGLPQHRMNPLDILRLNGYRGINLRTREK